MKPALEEDWGDLESLPPPRPGAPRWFWFCGGGCLLLLVATFVLTKFAWDWYRVATDEEQQWPKLARVLPFDERPEGYELQLGGGLWGYQGFVLTSHERAPGAEESGGFAPARRVVYLGIVPAKDRSKASIGEHGAGEHEVGRGELEIQGRVVPFVRLENPATPGILGAKGEPASASLLVDLSGGDEGDGLLLWMQGLADDPPTEDELREFLAPFHVGPERGGTAADEER